MMCFRSRVHYESYIIMRIIETIRTKTMIIMMVVMSIIMMMRSIVIVIGVTVLVLVLIVGIGNLIWDSYECQYSY